MAYEINIHVNKNGKLETNFPLELSVYRESKRVKLIFDVDSEIDSEYHYLKFTHARMTYLYRVHDNQFEIPKAVTAYEGRWEVSFVACSEVANSDSTITADYIYASEPIVADVLKGNLGLIHTSEESILLRQLTEGTFERFEIPSETEFITSYFLAEASNEFTVFVPYTVRTIKHHALYLSGCTSIEFEPGSQLTTLEDNALYRIENLGDITFPKSITTWGKYALSRCGSENVHFEANSRLTSLSSYAFWDMPSLKKLFLPDKLQSFSGGTAVIKNCPLLNEVWFPNTINVAIPQNSIDECPVLNKITLQSNFNISANFGNVTALTRESVIQMFRSLKDLTGSASKVISLSQVVVDRLTQEDMAIATNKNWSIGIVGGVDVLAEKSFHYQNTTVSMDISFGNDGTGTLVSGNQSIGFTYEYLTDTTFKITLAAGYDGDQWGNYRPAAVGETVNDTGVITISGSSASAVKIKTYSNTNTGTNRTFSVVTGGN